MTQSAAAKGGKLVLSRLDEPSPLRGSMHPARKARIHERDGGLCWNCGGDGFVSRCWEEWACADPEFGCDDCRWPCEVCNPPHPPEVVEATLRQRDGQS